MGNVQRSRETLVRNKNRAKQGKDQGKDRDEARESEETSRINSLEETNRINSLRVESLEPGKWMVHGLYEQQAQKAGLRRMDKNWNVHVLDFPHNAKLSRKELLQDLISGKRHLKAVPMCDISAAQGDVPHLTLRQLLRMRVLNPDFAPLGRAEKVQAFIEKLDALLFRRIGEAVSVSLCRFGNVNEDAQRRLGRDIAMVSAAAATLREPCWWVCFAGHHRIWFDPTLFKVLPYFPRSGGVLEIMDNSKVDRHSEGLQRCLDWEVCLAVREDQVSLHRLTTLTPRIPQTPAPTPAAVPVAPSIRFQVDRSLELTPEERELPPWVRPYYRGPIEEMTPEALSIIFSTRYRVPYSVEHCRELIAETVARGGRWPQNHIIPQRRARNPAPKPKAGPDASSSRFQVDCTERPCGLTLAAVPDAPSLRNEAACTERTSLRHQEDYAALLRFQASWGFKGRPRGLTPEAISDAHSWSLQSSVDWTERPRGLTLDAVTDAPPVRFQLDCTDPPPALTLDAVPVAPPLPPPAPPPEAVSDAHY